jgi:hypothetical protein
MMNRCCLTAAVAGLCLLPTASARSEQPDQFERIRVQSGQVRAKIEKIPGRHQALFSAGARNFLHRARVWSETQEKLNSLKGTPGAPGRPRPSAVRMGGSRQVSGFSSGLGTGSLTHGRVSDPLADAANNFLSGFVQSETSTAWCGDVALVGFNDSGSVLPSLAVGGLVFSGYSRSTDRGRSFTDMGFVPASNPDFELLGDPVMACGSQKDFHYANLLVDVGALTTGVGVSTSADGGASFAEPVKAVAKGLDSHFIDKEWMAVDPGHPDRLYVTYTDFDGSGDVCGFDAFGAVFRTGVELVRSLDGGQTWSAPVVVESACDPDGATGSQIVVGDDGTLYVAWEHFPAAVPNNEIRLRKSSDGGASFGPTVLVANTIPVGGNQGRQFLQGIIRIVEFPSLALDRSPGPSHGTLYVAWNDGSFATIPDPIALGGVYSFSDALLVKSTDGGASFGTPTRVNRGATTDFTDQYMPAVAVDKNGDIGVCYYDRRRDPSNFLTDRRCSRSADGGDHWASQRVNERSFPSTEFQDFEVAYGYQGDYDTLAGDFLRRFRGLLGAYADNGLGSQDVRSNRPPDWASGGSKPTDRH